MKFFRANIQSILLPLILLGLYTATVEMRPGRVYFVLQMQLFQGSVLDLLLFVGVVIVTVWGQLILLLNKHKQIRYLYLALLFPSLVVSLSYKFITGYNYAYTDAQTALNNLHSLAAALQNFALPVTLAVFSAGAIVWVFSKAHRFVKYNYSLKQAWLLIPITVLGFWYINRSAGIIDDLPAFYRVPFSTYLSASHELPLGERKPVTKAPSRPGVKHLFLIVDESITGSSISVNGNPVPTTPYLNAHPEAIVNLGIASAYTNNSAGSNIALMAGARMSQLPDKKHQLLTSPSIFQYAKKAGYKTYYIDAQIGGKALQNFMTLQDLESIDHFIQPADSFPDMPYYMRDHWVAELLVKLSKSEGKVFVYVTKAGAHWPYARTYPTDSAIFTPVLSERSMLKDKVRSVNTYHNSIRWSVDQFWKKLITNIQPQDSTFILYTSDHGQDLSGDGISIVHASTQNTKPIEADVPLWYLDKSGIASIYTSGKKLKGNYSHEQIFPTLLLLQGYTSEVIKKTYGATLFEKPISGKRKFLTGDIFGRGQTRILNFDN
ncbi:sulfatase-like hydrolase/transferase [Pontibacter sp. H259]|uniref:sulfatase-like hydrolase/transferase n=1 Tax=Pontibacter sp. H259 TaxID=3133421 RepID=UPI0030BC9A30